MFSQKENTPPAFIFCGQKGGVYSGAEILNCDGKLSPLDTNLQILSFRVTLAKGTEQKVYNFTGNKMSRACLEQIVKDKAKVYIELVKCLYRRKQEVTLSPMILTVK